MNSSDDSIRVDISDALSERDRVRFTVQTRTNLPQFSKPTLSVVRQHEEFIWLHDCLEDNDQYAGYIIPPPPPKPDFDASREKLQRLGDGEMNLSKEEFARMKQELEAEYLAIFKKTVAMHEMFLQRLAAHEKFREDNNFKIFLEYENELAVRCKSKKERITNSIQNIGKSFSDFVITTSQVAANTSVTTTSLLAGGRPQSPMKTRQQQQQQQQQLGNNTGNISGCDIVNKESNNSATVSSTSTTATTATSQSNDQNNHASCAVKAPTATGSDNNESSTTSNSTGDGNNNQLKDDNQTRQQEDNPLDPDVDDDDGEIDEQFFEKERLLLALYYNSIRDAAIQSDRATHMHKSMADIHSHIAQQIVKLASIEVTAISAQTKDASSFVVCPLPSLVLPDSVLKSSIYSSSNNKKTSDEIGATATTDDAATSSSSTSNLKNDSYASSSSVEKTPAAISLSLQKGSLDDNNVDDDDDEFGDNLLNDGAASSSQDLVSTTSAANELQSKQSDKKQSDGSTTTTTTKANNGVGVSSDSGCAKDHTSEGLKKLLLHVSDFFEQARKIETRIASDEDLKLTDLLVYYKRETAAAQDLLMRRLRFMSEYDTATKNLEKARHKGTRTQVQYAQVIQKQARENFVSISKLAKRELLGYKKRRAMTFKKAFNDLVELELKHLRAECNMIQSCWNKCY